jgi:hypothetical protein
MVVAGGLGRVGLEKCDVTSLNACFFGVMCEVTFASVFL